ncbi:hypothetical protein MUO_00455 [Listeria monocytogenes 07PF0776]|nr:hypothetical protein MUO_00455 [Listeria monocytogenes 07PF0776]
MFFQEIGLPIGLLILRVFVVFTLTDFIQIINADSNIKGIAINPFSNNFIVQRKNIRFLEEEMLNIKSGEQLFNRLARKRSSIIRK